MRLLIQRVKKASVNVSDIEVSSISKGLVILIGIAKNDSIKDAEFLAEKTYNIRVFNDEFDKMNYSLGDIGGSVLVVSQFTLYGDCNKGRRPSFINAADSKKGNHLYKSYVSFLKQKGIKVVTGVFGADMQVELINDGPVTLLLES